jgi:hypothetical protein
MSKSQNPKATPWKENSKFRHLFDLSFDGEFGFFSLSIVMPIAGISTINWYMSPTIASPPTTSAATLNTQINPVATRKP